MQRLSLKFQTCTLPIRQHLHFSTVQTGPVKYHKETNISKLCTQEIVLGQSPLNNATQRIKHFKIVHKAIVKICSNLGNQFSSSPPSNDTSSGDGNSEESSLQTDGSFEEALSCFLCTYFKCSSISASVLLVYIVLVYLKK